MTSALGIKADSTLLDQWRESFAPRFQPFRTARLAADAAVVVRRRKPTASEIDTFHLYDDGALTWLEQSEFAALPLKIRRALLFRRVALGNLNRLPERERRVVEEGRTDSRIVWWPSLLHQVGDRPMIEYIEHGLPPSRHREVRTATWTRASRVLPAAADLAGRFPPGSGPNCFSNVLAAAGVPGAESAWLPGKPLEDWLSAHTTPVRGPARDGRPGVVLVWRTRAGLVDHAAVTIGDGYALNKGSQGWYSPRVVWTVPETIAASRFRGTTLHRYLITTTS